MAARTTEEIAAYIRELRKDRGLRQQDLADALGLDKSQVTKIENNTRGLAVQELGALAGLLGVSVDDLLFTDAVEEVFLRAEPDADVAAARGLADSLIEDMLYVRALVG